MPQALSPYYFLDKTVNVLLVDDDPGVIEVLRETFDMLRIFNINTASSTRQASALLNSPDRFHVCIFDLGLGDINNDEFYLIKNFYKHTSFIVLTGTASSKKGFLVGKYGAMDLLEKSGKIDLEELVKTVNHNALLNIINPLHSNDRRKSLSTSTEVLFEKSPNYVTEWAIEMGVTDREIRHIWKKNLGANAKIILFIFHLFRKAFGYNELFLLNNGDDGGDGESLLVKNPLEYKKQEEYFHLHRSTILDYLAFGNIVNFL
ncbi:MAG: response regulator [Chitinivibrionales bacterium]|nr:response regulator [Chitinivibrionales bacterium]